MPHHVYRLSDDAVPVVVIAPGPLPMPAPHERNAVRVLVGVFDDIADAEAAAARLRARGALQDRAFLESPRAQREEQRPVDG
jgi:hypothetical protein